MNTKNTTRERILTAAGRLFWQRGYLGASVDEIAVAAKVNKTTVFKHFKTKHLILYELACNAINNLEIEIKPIAETNMSPEERLKEMIRTFILWESSNIGLAGIGQRERFNLPSKLRRYYIDRRDEVQAVFRRVIDDYIREKSLVIDSKVSTLIILSIINSLIQWYRPNGEIKPEQMASYITRFVLGALNSRISLDKES